MLKISLKFLNKEKQNTLFYLVFLILSQTAMAFYLNLALNPAYRLSFDVAFATICLAIALYVLALSFYAAKRYIETEVPLLGIFKLCGVSLSGMMHFISLQLIFIIGIAFLAGTLIGQVLLLIFSEYILTDMIFSFSLSVIFTQLFACAMEVLILMIVMTGFLYRYEVVALLDYQTSLSHQVKKNRILGFTLPRITALFFYLAFGLLILLGNASYAMLYLLIGVAGSYLFIIKTIKSSCHALLERGKRRKGYKHRLHLVSNSHIDNFLRNSIYFIQLLTFLDLGCLVLYDFFGTSSLNQVVLYTIIITGIFCTVLAVCFNLNKVLSYHIDECRQLKHLGYTHEALLKTLHQEIGKTLIILNLLALYYPLLLAVKMCVAFQFSWQLVFVLIGMTLISMLVGYLYLSKLARKQLLQAH